MDITQEQAMKHPIVEAIEQFTKKPLIEAAGEFLSQLGLKSEPFLWHRGNADRFFDLTNFTYGYLEEARHCVEHIWEIGDISNSSIQEAGRYNSILVYACLIKADVVFPRSMAVALTRAFNRVASRSGHFREDIPVIVLMLQRDLLTIASCERSSRLDNEGDKIGKVTMLRNINCRDLHPGHRQILERIANDVTGFISYEDLYSKWLKSFSIDIISEKFFKEYKSIYKEIVEHCIDKENIMMGFSIFPDPEKAIRDYVKKLMGRIVFIYFLQKKEWMGVPAGNSWRKGNPDYLNDLFKNSDYKDSFIESVLKPLFRDLNTNRSDNGDLVTYPCVEGGEVKVPYLNGGLFEEDKHDRVFFPLEREYVGKMLSFFSSYNFTIDENAPDDVEIGVDPEMLGRIFESLLEDNRRVTGAFYTPKDIVEYMCREALIAYLQTGIIDESTKQSYRLFVTSHKIDSLKPEDVYYVDKKLREVKICDPAIGSGAFPMGLLRELFDCRMAIERKAEKRTPAEIKKDIIQNSIYGVDIEKGAVDIARLRFWLSLVVEEERPTPLPNLDYKIMQGNSLLEWYQGVDLSHLLDQRGNDDLLLSSNYAEQLKKNLSELLKTYFDETNNEKKAILKRNISKAIKDILTITGVVMPDTVDVAENTSFFLWHIFFKEVFDNGGFDIVIGNPPYVATRSRSISNYEKTAYKQLFRVAKGQFDLYSLFIEKGLNLLKPSGIEALITESTFVSNKDFSTLRKILLTENTIQKLLYLGEDVFRKSAKVDVSIIIILKEKSTNNNILLCQSYDDFQKGITCTIPQSVYLSCKDNYEIFVKATKEDIDLLNEARKRSGITLGEIAELSRGAEFGANSELIFNKPRPGYDRLIVGKDIKKFLISFNNRYADSATVNKRWIYTQPKILIQRIRNLKLFDRIVAAYDEDNYVCTNTLRILYLKDDFKGKYDLRFLLGILNSSLVNLFFRKLFLNKDIYQHQLERIPIPTISIEEQSSVIELVNEIIFRKKKNPSVNTSDLETKIDIIIHDLYLSK